MDRVRVNVVSENIQFAISFVHFFLVLPSPELSLRG
jgi:hypothetical protein